MIDHMQRIATATTVAEVWDLHCAAMADHGFDRLLYAFTRFRMPDSATDSADDFVILSNHDPVYLRAFIDGGLYADAPMVRWAQRTVGAETWSWLARSGHAPTPDERRVIEFNRRMGVTAGVSISFPDGIWRSRGSIGLVARRGLTQDDVDDIWARHGAEIHVLNSFVHLKIVTLPGAAPTTLTQRQREALEWAGQGKTMQDIATIMEVSIATVEKHLRLAREALAAETTTQAVLKASFGSQIFTTTGGDRSAPSRPAPRPLSTGRRRAGPHARGKEILTTAGLTSRAD